MMNAWAATKRLLWRAISPGLRLVLDRVELGDPWEKAGRDVPVRAFGGGSVHDFRWYFDGESTVEVGSVEDVCEWLLGCEYASDVVLFNERDFWQHPRTFEELRKGDCEDHALWAWRKLVELGFEAELMVGHSEAERPDCFHAWVLYQQGGNEYILEATCKARDRMIRSLRACRDEYLPLYSVNGRFERTVYEGYLYSLRKRLNNPLQGGGRGGTLDKSPQRTTGA